MMNFIKKAVAVTALVIGATLMLVMPASAFFVDDAASNAAGMGQGRADVRGNGEAEGEANFSMSFTGRGKTKGEFDGNGDVNGNVNGYGEQRDIYRPPYYGTHNYSFPVESK